MELMKTVAATLYGLALIADIWGVLIVVIDIKRDMSAMRILLTKQQPTQSTTMKRYFGGAFIDGPVAAYAAQIEAENGDIKTHLSMRLEESFWKRWLGVFLIVGGSVVGFVGNLCSLYAS